MCARSLPAVSKISQEVWCSLAMWGGWLGFSSASFGVPEEALVEPLAGSGAALDTLGAQNGINAQDIDEAAVLEALDSEISGCYA